VSGDLRERLGEAGVVTELCDPSGRVLGHFVPVAEPERHGAMGECPYPDEELARMRAETGGRPLTEIWKSLGRA
jgi:hypothetical protein